MPRRSPRRLWKHDEVVAAVYNYRRELGHERFGVREFADAADIPVTRIYKLFGSWSNLREIALGNRHRGRKYKYTDDELFAEWHRVTQMFWRFPTWAEFRRHGRVSRAILQHRFGHHFELLRAYQRWLDAREKPEDGKPFNHHNPTQPRDGDGRDVRWMQKQWCALRVGFELRTSDFRAKGYTPDICDLLVVLENDEAPPMPLKVIELQQVVWV